MGTLLDTIIHNHHEGSDTGPLLFALVAAVEIVTIVLLAFAVPAPDPELWRIDPNLGP